ncbi:hypothetical protein T12_16984 [Trichinella patagoniensis]|uniref:Uncharacterized protein n=1 Tax=Trichinella patagoniensis TaxID=990121 RepID=A0A0V1A7V9_9BILA|nr:hypothetical protein T12_16984 [Trichinella patagoniensis]
MHDVVLKRSKFSLPTETLGNYDYYDYSLTVQYRQMDRIGMTDSMVSSSYSVTSERRCFVEAENSLQNVHSKQLLVIGICLCLTGIFWLAVAIALYSVAVDFYANLVYEARWLLAGLLLSGLFAVMLQLVRMETIFISCATCSIYSCSCCVVVFAVYAVNLHRSINLNLTDWLATNAEMIRGQQTGAIVLADEISSKKDPTQAKLNYVKLCVSICVVCVVGILLCILLTWRLFRIASRYYSYMEMKRSLVKFLCSGGTVQLSLALFSCYFAFQILALPYSYVHTFMIQELLCGLTLLSVTVLQFLLIFRPNRLLLKVLLVLQLLQFIQETFYSWNSYYISLYIHSSKAKVAVDLDYDQTVMMINFVAHFVRASICANAAMRLSDLLNVSMDWAAPVLRQPFSSSVQRFLIIVTSIYLLLAICHVVIDIFYTAMVHIYRTLLAFTGISVLYITMAGVCLSYFVRYKTDFALTLSTVFVLLALSVSVHALYVYVDTSLNNSLLSHLDTLGKEKRQPSLMHLAEAILAFFSLLISLLTAFALFRLMHLQSDKLTKTTTTDRRLQKILKWLWYAALILLALTSVEAMLNVFVKQDWQLFDNTVAYNVLDIISTYVLVALQMHVSSATNAQCGFALVVLFFLLLFETLTTFNYLSSYTNYMQLLIVLSQLTSSLSTFDITARSERLNPLLPLRQVRLLFANHIVQLIQWAVTIASVVLVGVAFELIVEKGRREIKPNTVTATTTITTTTTTTTTITTATTTMVLPCSSMVVSAYVNPVVTVKLCTINCKPHKQTSV